MESVSIKIKRTIKEGFNDTRNFGLKVALAKNRCVWENESLSSVQHKNQVILDYLKKNYQYLLDQYKETEQPALDDSYKNAPVWVFWKQGEEHMPEIIQLCLRSKIRQSNGHPVILLTEDNIKDYVDFPDYIWNQFHEGKIRVQHLADMIRVYLIYRYGGLWLDASVFCHKQMDDEIFKKQIFSLKGEPMPEFVSNNQWTTFIIGGSKGNTLCSFLNAFFLDYCKNNKPFIDYFMFDCAIALAYYNIPSVKAEIDSLPKTEGDVYWLNQALNRKVNTELLDAYKNEPSVFYKVAWKNEWKKDHTLYEYLLKQE